MMMNVVNLLLVTVACVSAFQPALTRLQTVSPASSGTVLQSVHQDDYKGEMDRRQWVEQSLTGLGLLSLSSTVFPAAAAAAEPGSSPDHPIVVLGAGGKVGLLCTKILAAQGVYCRAVSRQGRQVLDSESPYVTYAAGDVTKLDTLKQAVRGADGVIFAASASGKKKGGDPAHVDYLGAYNAAVACIDADVPKLAVVSAGTVTRPDSAGFQATNFFVKYIYGDNIMGYKLAGEDAVRDAYAAANKPGLSYTIIRPGGLSDGESVGPGKVHISQGDVYSSEIARIDVAEVTVAAVLKGAATDFTTYELNQQGGLGKAMKTLPDLSSELIHTGKSSYNDLLDGLFTDAQMRQKYPELMNDFKGGKIEPLSALS